MLDTTGEVGTSSKVMYTYGPPVHDRAKAGWPAWASLLNEPDMQDTAGEVGTSS